MTKENEIKRISITDDFMFATVLRQDKTACKRLLESILGFEISDLEYVKDQETINSYRDTHSIRLDVIAKDSGTIYDIEMQKINRGDIIKRSRYYQSQIDVVEFQKSKNYREIKDSYVIFICMFDLFGLDQYIYRFENYDESLKLRYSDGAKKIVINAKGHKGGVSDDLKAFISYLNNPEHVDKELANDFIKQLDRAVLENSENKEWKEMRMKYEADIIDWLDEGEARGVAKGIAKGIVEGEARGIIKGRAEGRAEGRVEGRVEGRSEGIAIGRENERLIIRRIFELAREGKTIDYIAGKINMPREYVEETLDMLMVK